MPNGTNKKHYRIFNHYKYQDQHDDQICFEKIDDLGNHFHGTELNSKNTILKTIRRISFGPIRVFSYKVFFVDIGVLVLG
jgi:hypothetical protein